MPRAAAGHAAVFAAEGLLFLLAAGLAWRVAVPSVAAVANAASGRHDPTPRHPRHPLSPDLEAQT